MRCKYLSSFVVLMCGAVTSMYASPALAWKAGTYEGTSADGQDIKFVVGTDSTSGKLQILSFNFGITAPCYPGTYTFQTAWGFGGNGVDLTTAKTTYTYSFGYVYMIASITYGPGGATGTITSYTPTFAPVISGHPKKSVFCTSPKQSFTTSYTPTVPASGFAKAAPIGMIYGALKAGN